MSGAYTNPLAPAKLDLDFWFEMETWSGWKSWLNGGIIYYHPQDDIDATSMPFEWNKRRLKYDEYVEKKTEELRLKEVARKARITEKMGLK